MEEMKRRFRGILIYITKNPRVIISNIVLVIAIGVFLFAGYKLISIFSEYGEGKNEYKKLEQEVVAIEKVVDEETGEEKEYFKVDFKELKAKNSDVVAWIRFEQPDQISYPVVKGQDNDKYLKTTVEGKKNSSGAIFMDANNTGDLSDRNTFIYGHNMKNGSMFGQLRKYKSKDFCKENPYFYVYTPDGKELQYQVFAVAVVEDVAKSYTRVFATDDEYVKYLKYLQDIALYNVEIELTAQLQIISLSTCTNVTETQRLLVHGVKIGETVLGE